MERTCQFNNVQQCHIAFAAFDPADTEQKEQKGTA